MAPLGKMGCFQKLINYGYIYFVSKFRVTVARISSYMCLKLRTDYYKKKNNSGKAVGLHCEGPGGQDHD